MAEDGYLVIADITGYTAFLSQSELEHAEDSLRSLLNLLLEDTKPPLVISRLEGDAVISYAPSASIVQGQSLVEILESTYLDFRRALQRMIRNTTCTCNACRNIPSLDLKFFVHYGAFILQPLASYTELIGSGVNLVHRLTKNSITEKTGIKAYAVYTTAAVEAPGIGDLCGRMTRHAESYEHLGEVEAYVQDMHEVWERRRDEARVVVRPEDAVYTVEHDFPLSKTILWDCLTKPEYWALVFGSESGELTARPDGRVGEGAVYYCAHGKSVYPQTIVDWHPFDQVTIETESHGARALCTLTLTPSDRGTKATLAAGTSKGPLFRRTIHQLVSRMTTPNVMKNGLAELQRLLEERIAAGALVTPEAGAVPTAEVDKAVTDSLTAEVPSSAR